MAAARRTGIVLYLVMLGALPGLVGAGCDNSAGTGRAGGGSAFGGSGAGGSERWTILCRRYSAAENRDHEQLCRQMAEVLRRVTQLDAREVRVETDGTGSSLYYGRYARVASGRGSLVFPPEFQRDIELIRSLSHQNFTPFFQARPEVMQAAGGAAGSPRHVSNCKGTHTLLIARFYNTPTFDKRVEAAEQYVGLLREAGYPAYYDHQDARSFVFVGDFGEEDQIPGPGGTWTYSRRVQELIEKNPAEFRYISENGHILTVAQANGERMATPSRLVAVPRPGEPPLY